MRLELSLDDIKPDSWSHIVNGDKKIAFEDLRRLAQAAVCLIGVGFFQCGNLDIQLISPPEEVSKFPTKNKT